MRKFYQFSRYLKQQLNLNATIRRTKLPNGFDADYKLLPNGSYLIRIDKTSPEAYAIDALMHEVAHVISSGQDRESPHGACWGKAYSKVYRIFERFNA